MVARTRQAQARWSLAELIDFEAVLAAAGETAVDDAGRREFVREIRPLLARLGDAAERRRQGLRLWLVQQHADDRVAGRQVVQALSALGWVGFAVLACTGVGLVAGLLLGPQQAVHVIVFFGLTLVLPWLVFAAGWLLYRLGHGSMGLVLLRRILERLQPRGNDNRQYTDMLQTLVTARGPRAVLGAELATLSQRAAIGFNLGLVLAFVGSLLLFDLQFYWEATPQAGMDVMLSMLVQAVASPWSWLWPQALPDMADIAATRALAGALPTTGDGSWWRFLLLSLLVWGLLPRLLLLGWFRWRSRQALARLDFQAPRHRALWRRLNAVERGEVNTGPTDGVLVLDVGGHGVTGQMLRGFLLRRLRVNPLRTLPIAVLDAEQEAQAHEALAAGPAGVVLLVEGWAVSPRQIEALQARLRDKLGTDVALTWLVLAQHEGRPAAPAAADMQRWAQQIDALRDPATEVVAYDG